jgi:pyrroloquinoline quinone biosynthesis protein D
VTEQEVVQPEVAQPQVVQPIDDSALPRLLRGVKLKHDVTRNAWVLLAPERVVKLNAISLDILNRCDGKSTLSQIVDELAAKYKADRALIDHDVRALLAGLNEKRMVAL